MPRRFKRKRKSPIPRGDGTIIHNLLERMIANAPRRNGDLARFNYWSNLNL